MYSDPKKNKILEQLFQENYTDLLKYAIRKTGNAEDSQDLVQQTFLVAYNKFDKMIECDPPRAWLFATLQRIIGNEYKHRNILSKKIIDKTEADLFVEPELNIIIEYNGMIDENALYLLKSKIIDGKKITEISEELGISEDTCKKKIQRAKTKFKLAYDKYTVE